MQIKWNNHVVILYGKDKDSQVAQALKHHIEREFHPCDVVAIDNVAYTNAFEGFLSTMAYRFCAKHARWILRVASEKRDKRNQQRIKEQSKTREVVSEKDKKKKSKIFRVVNIIKRFDPIVVICTSPTALMLAIRARHELGRDLRIVGAVTDFALDPAFVQWGADGYFVENPEIKQKLVHLGIEAERISVIGMPSLRPSYEARAERKRTVGITNDLPVVVVDGGAYGTDTIKEDIVLLMRNKRDFNLVILGANKKLRRYYMDLPEFSAGVIILDKLDENVLDIADIFVTVPNSKSVFAAFMRGVSVVIAQSVTNQEHEIRRYLVKRALVIPSRTPMETLFAVDELLKDPEREMEFKQRGSTYAAMSLKDIANLTPRLTGHEEHLRLKHVDSDTDKK